MSDNIEFVQYTPKVAEAIRKAMRLAPAKSNSNTHPKAPQQSLIVTPQLKQSSGINGYNSYFKLELVSLGDNLFKVRIYDGAYTWEENQESLNISSLAYVNNRQYRIQQWESDAYSLEQIKNKEIAFALQFIAPQPGYSASLKIVDLSKDEEYAANPDNDSQMVWYQLGRLVATPTTAKVVQDHLTGVAYLTWFGYCGETTESGWVNA